MAQSVVLLASSLNAESTRNPDACVCQKHSSGYVRLIAEWRTRIFRKDPETMVRLFPFGDTEDEDTSFQTTIDGNPVRRNILAVGLKGKNSEDIKSTDKGADVALKGRGESGFRASGRVSRGGIRWLY